MSVFSIRSEQLMAPTTGLPVLGAPSALGGRHGMPTSGEEPQRLATSPVLYVRGLVYGFQNRYRATS